MSTPGERTVALLAGLFKLEPHELVAGTTYPAAKADRLPLVANQYTEAEHQVALCEADLAWIGRGPSLYGDQRLAQWDVALRRLAQDCDRHDRELVEACHAKVRRRARRAFWRLNRPSWPPNQAPNGGQVSADAFAPVVEDVGQGLVEGDLGGPSRWPRAGGWSRPGGPACRPGGAGRGRDQRHRAVGQGDEAVGDLLDGDVAAGAHVVGLAGRAVLGQEAVGPDDVADVGEVPAGAQVADRHLVARRSSSLRAMRDGDGRGHEAVALAGAEVVEGPGPDARRGRGRGGPGGRRGRRRPCWRRRG